ncbi:hypothetical protein IH879_20030 [candidate division KSB1 bacterium]|nr:hypothetical protein [candidate division KSB1 bacterium]
MKTRFVKLASLLLLMFSFSVSSAQQDVTIVAPTSEVADGLDLKAVSVLFQDSENLESFERALNDSETGINNLDLNEDNEADFIRVVEQADGDARLIILQVPLAENEFQDVATIEVEKTADDEYNMQLHGNHIIYGYDYYVAPAHVHIHTWPIISWMYGPVYRPYRSVFRIGFYPRWYRPYRPVSLNVYRTRTVRFTSRTTFAVRNTSRVRSVTRINYKPRFSTLVKKKTKVTVIAKRNGRTTTVTKRVKKTRNTKTGKTTVKKGTKKTTRTKGGKKTTVKKAKVTKKRR